MNPIFSRTLKALRTVTVATLLSACGGASSTVDPFVATRVIAFGDGFNYVMAPVLVFLPCKRERRTTRLRDVLLRDMALL